LGAPFKAKFIWLTIIKKIERRLAKWKSSIYLRVVG
jgi:hypothetical protein